jgi:hypothetical protein
VLGPVITGAGLVFMVIESAIEDFEHPWLSVMITL